MQIYIPTMMTIFFYRSI